MIFSVTDNNGECYYINAHNVVYLKERKSYGLWKIVLVTGEAVLTKDAAAAKGILDFLQR